jgi:hypothetical protein
MLYIFFCVHCINRATIATTSHGSFNNVPRRSYIAISSYTTDLFSYSLTFNGTSNVGTLSTIGVPATSTLKGSILSETGKKLYPGASDGVSTLMVSVYDQISKVTGFINPNSPTFAIFTTDKPPYMGQGSDPGTDGRTNLGNSIYTHGSVIADGYGIYDGLLSTGTSLNVGTTARIGQSLSTGTSAIIGTTLNVGQSISSGTVVMAPSTFATRAFISPVGTNATSLNYTLGTANVVSGTPSLVTVATSACKTTSKVYVTNVTDARVLYVDNIVDGSFRVTGTNTIADFFNWLVIN